MMQFWWSLFVRVSGGSGIWRWSCTLAGGRLETVCELVTLPSIIMRSGVA